MVILSVMPLLRLGSVAKTIIHADEAENYLVGKSLTPDVMDRAARLASNASRPIDDIRGSAAYRKEIVRVVHAAWFDGDS